MLRLTANSLKNLSLTYEAFCPVSWNLQTVRWGRKPRWLPTAKTKLFRISPRIRIPKEEEQEIKRLYNNYRTQVKSLREYFREKYSVENLEEFDVEQHRRTVEEDFARCTKLNNEWNEEVRISREVRAEKEFQENLEDAKRRLEERLKIYAEQYETAEDIVRREKEAGQNFVTPEKLDAAIEYAINNPVDYNFALDLDGNKIRGRETKPPEKTEVKEKVSVKQ